MNNLRILIVEDNRPSQAGLMALLRREHSQGETMLADCVDEAFAICTQPDTAPDVVILDLDLPGGEPGESLIERLHARGGPMPRIVVTTGIVDEARESRVKALSPDVYLAKPYDRDRLLAAIAGD